MRWPLQLLLIEDSEDDAELLLLALASGGYAVTHERVLSAAALRDALNRGPWQLVVSDYTLPGFEAPEALEIVREFDQDLPFVVLSGTITDDIASQLLHIGANDYLQKGRFARLLPVVERELRLTEDRRSHREAELAAHRLAAIVWSSSDAIIAEDLEGTITSWNPAAERLYRWTAAEAIGNSINLIVPPDKRQEMQELLAFVRTGRELAAVETERVCRDATRIPVSISVSPVLDLAGNLIGFSRITRDLTREKRREDQLRQAALILANVRDAVIVTDLDGVVTYWNEGATRLFGWSAEEMLGADYAAHYPDRSTQESIREAIQERAAGNDWEGEYEDFRKDGSRVWIQSRVTRISDANGTPIGTLGLSHDISERKRTESELRHSEEQYRALAENLPQMVWVADEEGRTLYLNPVWVQYTGCEVAECDHAGWAELIHPEERTSVLRHWEKCRAEARVFETEFRLRRVDGEYRWQLVKGVPTSNLDTEGIRWIGTCQDIDAQMQERLAQAELAALVDATVDAIISVSPDGRVRTWNSGAERILGYKASEVVGRDISVLDAEEASIPALDTVQQVFRGEVVRNQVALRRRKDGQSIWFNATVSPVKNEAGETIAVVGIGKDITDELRLQREREELLARFRLYLDRMPIACVTLDPSLRIQEWGPSAERIFGHSAADVTGKHYDELNLVAPESIAACEEIFRRLLRGEMDAHCVSKNISKEGRTIECEWYNTPVLAADGTVTGILLMAVDVTERRHLESQLHQSQKMEAFGQLAGGIAHDFNNMLMVINGYSDLVLSQLPQESVLRGYLQEVLEAGERAAALTRQLLTFSRREIVVPETLEVNEAISGCHRMLRRLIGENIELVTVPSPTPAHVRIDRSQLEQVIVNLCVNARDAMPKGGTLKLRIEAESMPVGPRIHGSAGSQDKALAIHVEDTGVGIDPENLPRVFEPFFTTKGVGKGTGLGLATVYGIVKQNDGHIEVSSRLGEGTRFSVYLPVDDSPIPEGAATCVKHLPTGSETVMVVEDEPVVRALVVSMLRHSGYSVLEALQPEDALALIDSHDGPLHLLISDVVMPQMSGPVLAEKILQRRPGTPVLFISGYTDDAVVRHGVLRDEVDLLQKPFTVREFGERVRSILDRRAAPRGTGSILIVDDAKDHRESLGELLQLNGYLVTTAGDGAEALAVMANGFLPDLILFDLVMSPMNGWVFRQELQKDPRFSQVPAIVMSGRTDPGAAADFLEVSASLLKPIRLEELLRAIDAALHNG